MGGKRPRREESDDPRAIRAFVALELPVETRARIAEVVGGLQPRLPGVRWTSPDGWHVTLRFLGYTDPTVLADLEPMLRGAAAACAAVDAQVGGLGLFPERGSPRVLWLHVELPEPVLRLQAACEAVAVGAGFPRENRPFRSHLTLGRWRDRAPRPSLPEVGLGPSRIEHLVLFKSELRSTGAVYTPLATFPLGGA